MNLSRCSCLVVVAFLTLASDVLGDGCYMPKRAFRKIPEIPAQRALLSWKDGQETLVIASALDSKSQELGWIIPLPSVPTTIGKETPGALKTLNFCLQPEITHDLHPAIVLVVVLAFVGNLVVATWLFKRKSMLNLLMVLIMVFVFFSSLLPASGPTRPIASKAPNVQVEKSVSVGVYDIKVLKPAKPNDLNAWLTENGFSALPAVADKTVADYISNGWVFAAIKLTRAESGRNAPHPIKMAFASKRPVYPLRLTALAGGTTAFELFVIADDRAACDSLKEELCERFTVEKWLRSEDEPYETEEYFRGETTNQQIGHPAICSLMWNKCILTKFAGPIDADKMTSDIQFDWKPFEPYREHLFTIQGAREVALIVFIAGFGASLAVSMFVCQKKIVQPKGFWRYLGRVLLPSVALVAIFAAGAFICLPKLDASKVVQGHVWMLRASSMRVFNTFKVRLDGWRPKMYQDSEKEIADRLLKLLSDPDPEGRSAITNQLTGTEVIVEDSPGNFTVEKSDKKVIIRVYDAVGRVMVIERPSPQRDKQGRGGQAAK
jgi:hypothetical protein